MQLSTSLFYDRASTAMTRLSSRADTLQTQISTGKKLAQPSDDSVAFTRLQGLARDSADAIAHAANLDVASSIVAQADTTLGSIATQLQRASELALSARNGTQDATSRSAIAAELEEIRDQLVSLGNTADSRGQPLFGGGDGTAAVTQNADGSYGFASASPSAIPIGNGQAVQPSETAARVFQVGGGNALTTITQLAAALRSGTDVDGTAATAIDDLGAQSKQVLTVQSSLGARASRIELEQSALTQTGVDREATRSALEDTDVTAAITELQKTMTVLSATQASFTKLQGLSLFDYLK